MWLVKLIKIIWHKNVCSSVPLVAFFKCSKVTCGPQIVKNAETKRKKTGQDSNRNTNYALLSWKEEKEREREGKGEQARQSKVSLSHNTHTAECKISSGLSRSEVKHNIQQTTATYCLTKQSITAITSRRENYVLALNFNKNALNKIPVADSC